MRILILTQYFPPETGAPQNRLASLADHLVSFGHNVKILTAMPNYPVMKIFPSYRKRFILREQSGSLKIIRSWIYVSKNKGLIKRLCNYFSFVFSSIFAGLIYTGKQDVIICESPPLFLSITALIFKKLKKSKIVFNVSDLWPESVIKLNIVKNKLLLTLAYKLEKIIYKNSLIVTCQTKGIINDINKRYPFVKTYWLPNGVDFSKFNVQADGKVFRKRMNIQDHEFVILYAGIFGYAQGLEIILKAAAETRKYNKIKYILAGDGPERGKIEGITARLGLSNVILLNNLPHQDIPYLIASSDAYLVPLKKNDLFRGAIPSKLFEPLAIGKPIILGVDGEAKELFINRGNCGVYYEPENVNELVGCILKLYNNRDLALKFGNNGKIYVEKFFNREKIAFEFNQELMRQFNG